MITVSAHRSSQPLSEIRPPGVSSLFATVLCGSLILAIATTPIHSAQTTTTAKQVLEVVVTQPVQVAGTVETQGVVETLNDAVNTPFVGSLSYTAGEFPKLSIPAGKRLVVESVCFNATCSTGTYATISMVVSQKGFQSSIILPTQEKAAIDGSRAIQTAVVPLRVRVDSDVDSINFTAQVFGTGLSPYIVVTVTGYLVDL
jgi:hypothetical protein